MLLFINNAHHLRIDFNTDLKPHFPAVPLPPFYTAWNRTKVLGNPNPPYFAFLFPPAMALMKTCLESLIIYFSEGNLP